MASSQSPTGKAPASTHLPPFDLSEKTNKSGQAIGEAAGKIAGEEGNKEREIAPKDGKANSGAFKAVKEKVIETGRKVGLK